MSVAEQVDRALGTSRLARSVRTVLAGSRTVAAVSEWERPAVIDAVNAWLDQSIVGQWATSAGSRLGDVAAGAAVGRLLSAIAHGTRQSWLYRWLTAEPEPDVIVIDLRETVTVRPFLVAVEESIGLLLTGQRTSIVRDSLAMGWRRFSAAPVRIGSLLGLAVLVVVTLLGAATGSLEATGLWLSFGLAIGVLAGTRVEYTWRELGETRPVRIAIALLEPPDPPAERRRGDSPIEGAPDAGERSQPNGDERARKQDR